jgi:hypothetical protein
LHDRLVRRAFAAHEHGHADETLVADDRDFCCRAVLHYVKQRHDAVGRKIDEMERLAGSIEDLAQGQRHQFEMRKQAALNFSWQRSQEMVLPRSGSPGGISNHKHLHARWDNVMGTHYAVDARAYRRPINTSTSKITTMTPRPPLGP